MKKRNLTRIKDLYVIRVWRTKHQRHRVYTSEREFLTRTYRDGHEQQEKKFLTFIFSRANPLILRVSRFCTLLCPRKAFFFLFSSLYSTHPLNISLSLAFLSCVKAFSSYSLFSIYSPFACLASFLYSLRLRYIFFFSKVLFFFPL